MTDSPVILKDNVPFDCGLINGSVDIIVSDQYCPDCIFPVQVIAHTPVGARTIFIETKGNEHIHENIVGIDVDIYISNWNCDSKTVACHVKVVAKKLWITCTILDKDYHIERHNSQAFEATIANFHAELEASEPS